MSGWEKHKRFGDIGETVLRNWLKERGYYVVPTSLIENGGAPMLESHLRSLVLPDTLIFKGGEQKWVEVKAKTLAPKYNIGRCHTTGCALRHWNDYRQVQEATGITGALAFVHVWEQKLLLQDLDRVVIHNHYHGPKFREPMIFFEVDGFEWFSLDRDSLFSTLEKASEPPATVHPWSSVKPRRLTEQLGYLYRDQ